MGVAKLNIVDGLDAPQKLNQEQHTDGSLTPYHALEINDLPVGLTNPLPVMTATGSYSPGAPTGSLTLTTAGASQVLTAANSTTTTLVIGNPSTAAGQGIVSAESIWINFAGGVAVGSGGGQSHEILPGGSITLPGPLTTAVNWIAATAGHKISATVL